MSKFQTIRAKVSPYARTAIFAITSVMASVGVISGENAIALSGAVLTFGAAFWKAVEAFKTDAITATALQGVVTALSAVLLAYGYTEDETLAAITGTAGVFIAVYGLQTKPDPEQT